MNDIMNIHFFRNSTLGETDFNKVLEFFDTIPNFTTYYTDDEVEIEYKDKEFDFEYRYLITKKSRVSKIYKLDPMYSNINFLLEMPLVIPTFLAKEVFTITQKLCKVFELGYYHDSFDDVQAFNIVDLLVFFDKQRSLYIDENGLNNKIYYNTEKLNVICKFQRSVDSLIEYYHNDVTVNLCYPVVDKNSNESGICYDWRMGTAIIFAPYVDYINIQDVEEGNILIKKDVLFGIIAKYLVEIKNFLPDMYIIKPNKAKACTRELRKIKKAMLLDKEFKVLHMTDIIDE